eukprot:gnl/MRDRNA2_/MRDRNA2_65756_c0_seq1.p1 gnl/MRDRNA2_/MRDRNA2_65756_c0~~gnl/MRDRNA2_/MRDRNA2_65756_c0_seq1.p1  ORF type:complete len:349 (-),score=55.10 gnl/MRDRNA2_/MRDRNA2_65756_c0_seq1:22-1068(-)
MGCCDSKDKDPDGMSRDERTALMAAVPPSPAPSINAPIPMKTGRKKALLVGINYFGTRAELRGCINDVHMMAEMLITCYGFDPQCIRTLTDDNLKSIPTRQNITEGLRWLVQGVQPGDALFFSFSGHGAQMNDPYGYEEDGMNETILPVDFQNAGQITDDEIGDLIVKPLPDGVRLTCVMDSCHSGTGLDLPYTWTPRWGWKEETNPYHSLGDVVMFSGCEDDDCSADAIGLYGLAGGVLTTAFCATVRQIKNPTYPELLNMIHAHIRKRGFGQRPVMTSSQKFDVNRKFQLDDVVTNTNDTVGRTFRRKFPPRPRPLDPALQELIGGVAIGLAVHAGASLLMSALFE